VVLVARRGPAQAAFTPIELEEISKLASIGISLDPVKVDPAELVHADAASRKNVELMQHLAVHPVHGTRTLRLEFLASPVELLGDDRVRSLRLERNELIHGKARGTGKYFELETGLVFRSIGYFGEPLPGVPFDSATGTIPNEDGRVLGKPRWYAVGWIRRTATGVIGTNKVDAHTVVEKLIEDVPTLPDVQRTGVAELLRERGVRVTTWEQWLELDRLEISAGRKRGKVREKFASVSAMLEALLV
jgi:ferredoxin--NADP+ reductase